MDPIFDFILEGEPQGPLLSVLARKDGKDHHIIPSSPTSCAPLQDLCCPSSPIDGPSSPSQQNEIDEITDEYISSVADLEHNAPPIPAHVRDTSIALIEEYLQDSIPLKAFLQKIRAHLCVDSDRKDMFDWVIRSMISCGHSSRMSSFLEENGIKKEEIEAASVKAEENNGMTEEDGLGIGEKRKRRERKRVSISRGLRSPPNKWTKQESEKLIRSSLSSGTSRGRR